ncbi:anthocyanidin 3-O-glucosyltransferase 2-like [Andrographis paniculata]|nr:anthocyanidin 3-O-glucosyltransferase 2-like [Andrographis paniculata]QZJ84676.1 UDP-glycosyltransferase 5 [Andrographis paniculata]
MSQLPVELVFIPSPGLSHLVSTIEAAKLLLVRGGNRLAVTVLIIKLPKGADDQKEKISSIMEGTIPRLRFVELPDDHNIQPGSPTFLFDYIDNHADKIRQFLSEMIEKPLVPGTQLAGLVLDMFCTSFIQVGNEFSIPSYVFFTSGALTLGTFYDLVSLKFEQNQDLAQYKDSHVELSLNCASHPIPVKLFPTIFFEGSSVADLFLGYFQKMTDTKGVLVNTFYDLQKYTLDSLSAHYNKYPKVYPIGPILKDNHDGSGGNPPENDVIKWLDDQPEDSVVFLCFGTMGAFEEAQVREFAKALEDSGSRFVWSLRKPSGEKSIRLSGEYGSFDEVLPEGFLERTAAAGRVIGWAPQVAVLAHAAVGGFVSHCGWNSVLETVWHGVPVAALPLYAEQHMNAFELATELGIAEVIRSDYKTDSSKKAEVIPAGEIEAAIRRVMAAESGVREKMKEMQRKSREALKEGGSSYASQMEFLQDVLRNVGLE